MCRERERERERERDVRMYVCVCVRERERKRERMVLDVHVYIYTCACTCMHHTMWLTSRHVTMNNLITVFIACSLECFNKVWSRSPLEQLGMRVGNIAHNGVFK